MSARRVVRRVVRARRARGSVLVLLLLVVLAAAVVLMDTVSPQQQTARRERQTRQQLARASEALAGYALSHGRLPRPATAARDGVEGDAPCDSEEDCTGLLPWRTLGLAATDGWGRLLHYSVTPAMTLPQVSRDVVPTKAVLRREADGSTHYIAGQDECSIAALCLPALVFSNGRDLPGFNQQGVWQAGNRLGSADARANLGAGRTFISAAPGAAGAAAEQLFSWVEPVALLRRMDQARLLH